MDDHDWTIEDGCSEITLPCRYQLATRGGGEPTAPLLVALHGMGMTGGSFLRILRHLPVALTVLAPDGPYPFEQRGPEGIRVGHAWYIYRGDQPEFREHLGRSERYLMDLITRVAAHAPSAGIRTVAPVLLGFSQGGYLAGFAALRHAHRFSALVIASSRLKHEFLAAELDAGKLPPALFLHSRKDRSIPWQRAQEGVEMLAERGGDAELFLHDGGHRLPPEALHEVAAWLRRKQLVK